MTNLVYPKFREAGFKQLINVATADWRAALLMSTTSAVLDTGAEFLSSFTTLGEFNGIGYARKVLASEAVTVDLVNGRIEIDAADIDFGVLHPGSAAVLGVLLYLHTGADSANRPAAFIDETKSPGPVFPYTPIGAQVRLLIDTEGFLHV